MKKDSYRNSFFVFVSGAFLFLCVLFLASCDNFLKGSNIRQDLEEAIEIANTQPTTFYVIADEDSGTVTPSQLRLKKKETFDVMFTPKDDWKFLYWEVLDRTTNEPVENIIKFKNEKDLETQGTVLSVQNNLYIHPKCLKLPAIISHSPNDENQANYANTPIILDFNMELAEENFAEDGVLSGFDYISITYEGASLTKYFEKPVLNANKTSVTIMPKADDFVEYIKKKGDEIDIVVTLKDTLQIFAQGENLQINKNNLSFTVKYLSSLETEAPQEVDNSFFVARPDDLEKHFILEANVQIDPENTKRNRVKDKIYIYGKYRDRQSGVKKIVITEQRALDQAGHSVVETVKTKEFFSERPNQNSATFIKNNDITEFFIENELESDIGAIKLQVTVYDACNNAATTKTFVAIKVSQKNFLVAAKLFDVYNYPDMYREEFDTPPENFNDNFDYTTYETNLKKLRIENLLGVYKDIYPLIPLRETIFDTTRLDPDAFNIRCEYIAQDGKPDSIDFGYVADQTSPYWETKKALNVEKVSGLKIKVIVEDDIGLTVEKECLFAPEPEIVIEKNSDNQKPRLFYEDLSDSYDGYFIKTPKNQETPKTYLTSVSSLEDNYEYQVIPRNGFLLSEVSSGKNRTEKISKQASIVVPNPVEWETDYPKILPVSESPEQGKIIISVKLKNPQDQWANYTSIYCHAEAIMSMGNLSRTMKSIKQYFSPGTSTIDYIFDTTDIYTYNIQFTLYGIKDGVITTGNTQTLTKISTTNKDYDNIPPKGYLTYKNFDEYHFNMTDNYSGPKSVSLIKSDDSEILLKQDEYVTQLIVDIPTWMLAEYGTTLKMKDMKENEKIQTFFIASTIASNISSMEISLTGWKLVFKDGNSGGGSFKYYFWDDENKTWVIQDSLENEIKDLRITSNQFVKIENNLYATINGETQINYSRIPRYFYCIGELDSGAKLNSGHYDYITPYDSEYLFVISDAPTYVETIVTTRPYKECKNWNQTEWEGFHRREGLDYMAFPVTNPSPMRYKIPLDKISSGECYVILAHFADGTSFMTEVRQKP